MKVILANHSGVCFGVEKAIYIAFDEIQKGKNIQGIYSLGPLIHNDQVVKKLEEQGLKTIHDIDEVSEGKVIIRSHGVPKSIYDKAKLKAIEIIDATCPFVRKIQNIVKNYYSKGYTIAIIGNPKHPEVIGINGWCENDGIVIENEEDVEKLGDIDQLCIVVQTTMPISKYQHLSSLLEKKAKKVEKNNTICLATSERQDSARKLAKQVDAMIVIGGYHSSNTQKLASVCREEKPEDTYHIETAEELPFETLKQYDVVGVTAGASTPKWIIDEVVQKLLSL